MTNGSLLNRNTSGWQLAENPASKADPNQILRPGSNINIYNQNRVTNGSMQNVSAPIIPVGAIMDDNFQRDTNASLKESEKRPVQIKEFINPISFKSSVPFYSGKNLNFTPMVRQVQSIRNDATSQPNSRSASVLINNRTTSMSSNRLQSVLLQHDNRGRQSSIARKHLRHRSQTSSNLRSDLPQVKIVKEI
jgi:hypothetical protein